VPSIDFTFKIDLLDASKGDFAVMRAEVNGKYYEAGAYEKFKILL
jgi:hypothetical protein